MYVTYEFMDIKVRASFLKIIDLEGYKIFKFFNHKKVLVDYLLL